MTDSQFENMICVMSENMICVMSVSLSLENTKVLKQQTSH